MQNKLVAPSIALVTSRFNETVTSALHDGCKNTLIEQGVPSDNITSYWVPGAVEIPLIAKLLAKTGKFNAIIAMGAVIQGETTHFDYVCDQVNLGCQQVMLEHEIPVIFGVLTTKNMSQAVARTGGDHGHKGKDAALAALEMLKLVQSIG